MTTIITPATNVDITNNNKLTIEWYTVLTNLIKRILGDRNVYLGGVDNNDSTSNGNVDGGTTDLTTYTLGSKTLNTIGDYAEVEAFGIFAPNASPKAIALIFGSTTIYSIPSTNINNGSWSLRARIIRTVDANTQEIIVEGNGTDSVLIKTVYTLGAENLITDLIIKVSATGTSSDNITQKNLTIKLYIQ